MDAKSLRNAASGVLGGESGFFVQRVVIKASRATTSMDAELKLNAEHGVLGGESARRRQDAQHEGIDGC